MDLEISNTAVVVTAKQIFYLLAISIIILVYVYWRLSRKRIYELTVKIPGPKGWPIIGNVFDFVGASQHEIFNIAYKYSLTYSTIAKVWVGPFLAIFLVDPRDVEVILSSHDHIDKPSEYKLFEPWLGNGLLISTGQLWRSHRKIIAPSFHLHVLKSFIDLFNANSRLTVQKLENEIGKTFDCHDYMAEATVEILLETVMGVSKETQKKTGFEYAMAVMKMCHILHSRHTKPWLRPDVLFKFSSYSSLQDQMLNTIHDLTHSVVKNKSEAFNNGIRGSLAKLPLDIQQQSDENKDTKAKTVVEGLSFGQSAGLKDDLGDDDDVGEKKRLAFLDQLIESKQNGIHLTEEQVKEQVTTIMFEGHDTTAAASSFFLSLMGIHQEIQNRVLRELDSIFGDSNRPASFADTLEMKYLERCILETIRLYPPVPMIGRILKKDVKMASGDYIIPAGTPVAIVTFGIHRRKDIYPNPNKFDPDNFLPEHTANRHYYGFIPFSAGPRSCVGRKYAMLKLKILLSTVLRNYRIMSDLKESDFKLQGDVILKRSEGFPIRLEGRKPTKKTL